MPDDFDRRLSESVRSLDPITISWTMRRSSAMPTAQLLKTLKLPPQRLDIVEPQQTTFIFQDGKCYQRFIHKVASLNRDKTFRKLGSVDAEASYDDQKIYSGSRKTNEPKSMNLLIITKLAELRDKEGQRPYFEPGARFLFEAGYWFPSTPVDLGKPPLPLVEHFRSQGGVVRRTDEQTWNGKRALRLQMQLTDGTRTDLWHLFEKGYPLCRREKFDISGRLLLRSEMAAFAPLPDADILLPRQALVDHFTWPTLEGAPPTTTLLVRETLAVTSVKRVAVSDEQFVIAYTSAGSYIADGSLPRADETESGRIEYRVPANPEDLDEAIRLATERAAYNPSFLRIVAIIVQAAGVIAVVVVLIAWRRRTRSTR